MAKVELNPSCRVLVGINESGKSNILKALALLDEARTTTQADVRFPLEDEPPPDEAFVRFVFVLDEAEIGEVYENALGKVLCKNTDQKMFINNGKQKMDLKDFCRAKNEGIYRADVLKTSKSCSYWPLPKNAYSIEKGWAKPSKVVPADFLIDVGGDGQPLKDFLLINKN